MSEYESIVVLSGLEAVRLRPELYTERNRDLAEAVVEASLCLGMKAMMAGCSTSLELRVEGAWAFSVRHSGRFPELLRGMDSDVGADDDQSLTMAEAVMSVLWACKWEVGTPDVCEETLTLATALSSRCSIEVCLDGVSHRASFEDGVPRHGLGLADDPRLRSDGVLLFFSLDPKFFGDGGVGGEAAPRAIRRAADLVPGSTVQPCAERVWRLTVA